MEIEIVTTKKKLTKSIVNQMRHATLDVLKDGKPLGFVIGVIKDNYKAIIIEYDGDYYIVSAYYTKGDTSVYRKIGRWSSQIKFETPEVCNEWWSAYQIARESAMNHIYI